MWTTSFSAADTAALAETRLEVVVSFDGAVLGVHHLAPGHCLIFGPPAPGPPAPAGERTTPLPDYPLELLPAPLAVASHGAAPCCEFPIGASGAVIMNGVSTPLAALVEARLCQPVPGGLRYALPPGAELSADIGPLAIHVRQVALQQRLPRAPLDLRAGRFIAGSVLLHGILVALALLAPPDPRALASQDLARLDHRLLATRLIPPLPPVTEVAKVSQDHGGARARAAGPLHAQRAPVTTAPSAPRSGPRGAVDAQSLRELTRGAGLLSVLGTLRAGSPAAGLFSRGQALDDDAARTLLGLTGEVPADPYSTGPGIVQGGGGRCSEAGCDQTVEATFSVSRPGVRGARPLPPLQQRQARAPSDDMLMRPPTVRGKLPAEIVRRVVRSRMNEFRFCYERSLAHTVSSQAGSSGLRGRVVVSFLIGGDGRVLSAVTQESSLNSPAVQECVNAAVRRLSFPQPEGSGLVQVQYPFVFQPAGG